MVNRILIKITFFTLIVLSISAQEQNVEQISECIGNCMFCSSKSPAICLDQNNQASGSSFCLPFYQGTNCQQQTYGFEKIINQNGTFPGWTSDKTTTCHNVQKNAQNQLVSSQNMTYVGLGEMKANQSVSRTISFANGTVMSRVMIKFSIAIDDPTIEKFFSSSANNTTEPSPTKQIRQLMTIELTDNQNKNATIQKKTLTYNMISVVQTSCGFVYTYQPTFNLDKQYTEIGVKLSLLPPLQNNQQNITWTILNFDFTLGCRGFVVSSNSGQSNCDSCLSGFYPKLSLVNAEVEECKPCDFRCKTCFNATVCLTCMENTVFNDKSGMCEFSQYFAIMPKYHVVTGKVVDVGQLFGSQCVRSQGGILQLQQPLQNTQAYRVSFLILYSAVFRNSNQAVNVTINNKTFSFNSGDLPLDVPTTINDISSFFTSIYQTRLNYNVNGTPETLVNAVPNSSNLNVSSRKSVGNNNFSFLNLSATSQKTNIKVQTTGGEEIAVTNVNVVQFKCSQNCKQCTYSQYTQTSQCTKCAYFFDLSTNCLNCANGYYPVTIDQIDQCIKCHSTCKQCTGPQVTDCLNCFDGFELGEFIYDYKCITCLYKSRTYNSSTVTECINAPECLKQHSLGVVLVDVNCKRCFSSGEEQLTTTDVCKACWLHQDLAKSYCQPLPERGYQLYGSDVSQGVISSQWTSNKELVKKTITPQYTDLYGVDWDNTSQNQTTTITFTQPILPSHRGITIFFTIFKLNTWSSLNTSATLNMLIRSQQKYTIVNNTININSSHGYNIYGASSSGNQMMYTYVGNSQEHSYTGKFEIIITTSHTGVFVKDLEVYLGNCDQCDGNKMTYEVYYIPVYSTNDTQTGVDVWLTFNQGVKFVTEDQTMQDKIINSFQFSIDQLGYQNLIPFTIKDNQINTWNFVKYFLPINGTLINATLRVNNSMGYSIYSKISKLQAYLQNPLVSSNNRNLMSLYQDQDQVETEISYPIHSKRLLLNQRLSSTNVEQKIHRYEDNTMDQRKSMQQLDEFFDFFQWFTLIAMIIFAFFGLGIIFQEFSILIQLLFMHIYISTQLLPASYKEPLSHMQKMENLNFFAYPHAQDIENSWFSNINQSSPYPFTQFNVDVYFARSFYPIIIINIIYIFYFTVLFCLLKFFRPFRTSPNKIVKFFRDIPQRPMNYFDQIWRYQFITTMWACFMQFHSFDGSTAEMRLNLALCIAAFVISLIWPVFVMVYTYHQHFVINVEHFLYLYNDIYYRKISSIAEKTSYYLYIAVRFGRYFFYTLFIAVFIFQNIIGPVILMAATLLQIIYIINFKIYRDKVYLMFKLIQNFGFIILEILLLIIYGFSDDTISKDGFTAIGYGLDSLYILMIINGIARFLYLGYKKTYEFLKGRYDYGEKGELQNYDQKNPVTMELPTTQRGLF